MRGIGALCRGRPVWLPGVLAAGVLWLAPATASAALVWSAPLFLNAEFMNAGLADLACPTSTHCVAVDASGREVAFDPADPSAWTAYTIDGTHALTDVSCPAASQCAAVDHRGAEITFDPEEVGAAPQRHVIDPGHSLDSVSCPSIGLCVAVDGSGDAVTFDPEDPSSVQSVRLGTTALSSVSCPSTTQCTALASGSFWGWAAQQAQRMVTFDPQTLAIVSVIQVPETADVTTLSCPTTDECVGAGTAVSVAAGQPVDEGGSTVTFDPTSSAIASGTVRSAVIYLDVACVSASVCTAMDASGTEVSFDPNSSGVLEQAAVDPLGDWSKGLNGSRIACLPAGVCVLATTTYESAAITFEPLAPGTPAPVAIDDGAPIAAVACPAPGDCIEVANTQSAYTPPTVAVASFDSVSQGHVNGAESFPGPFGGFACPKRNRCTVVMTQKTETGPGACGCSWSSAAATFDPAKPTGRNSAGIKIDAARIAGLACPDARECTAVDARGREVNFNPTHPRVRSVYPESTKSLSAITCPSATQCTAVGKNGTEVTFAPGTGWLITRRQIDAGRQLTAVACPSARQCSTADQLGREITFDPQRDRRLVTDQIGTTAVTGIACPSRRLCVAVTAVVPI